MRRLGVGRLILTNAAGGVNAGFRAGDLMLIVDHLNLVGMAGHNPLIGPNVPEIGTRFPSMTHVYARPLRKAALESAQELGITLRQGVYAFLAGPNFETPAEVRYLRLVGADAVGMSTVPEALVAVHAGIEVLGISTITNVAIDHLDADKETSERRGDGDGKNRCAATDGIVDGRLGTIVVWRVQMVKMQGPRHAGPCSSGRVFNR